MRLIDVDRMKKITPNWLLETDGVRERYLYDVLDHQPTVIEGNVQDAKFAYQRITKVKPLVIYYEVSPRQVKYVCPVCRTLGSCHQLTKGAENCSLCNVNLTWDGID